MTDSLPIADSSFFALRSVRAGYGSVEVLHDIDFSVPPGSVVALIGANGAGKTTLLKVAAGIIGTKSGSIVFDGQDTTGMPTYRRAEKGVCLIPEGRGIFRGLSVRENLRLAVPPWASSTDYSEAVTAFPVLGRRLKQLAGTLSGGEQQMLAMARAYLSKPKLILIDELSLGLAPVIVDQMFESVQALANSGVSIVIVEQYVHRVLELAGLAYILVHGRMAWHGEPDAIDDDLLMSSYLGQVS